MSEARPQTRPSVAPEPEPAPAEAVPAKGRSAPRWAVVGILLFLAVHAVAYARAFLMPVVLAVLLALVFGPLRRFLERSGISSAASAFVIVGALLTALVVGVLTLSGPVSAWIDNAPSIGWRIEYKLREWRGAAEGMREAAEQIEKLTSGGEEVDMERDPTVQRIVVDQPFSVADLAVTAPAVLAQVVFTLILLFFLMASGDMFYEKIVHVMPTFRDKRRALRIARDIERKLSRYLFTITVINAGLGVAVGIAMALLGMPNPVLFGVAGFLLNFIPYLGAIVGTALALVVALVSLDTAQQAVLAGGAYFLLTTVEGQLVTPYFVGRRLRLNTVVVFLSVTLWAWLWSVIGMLVATPMLVTMRTLCEHIPALEGLGNFLSERGAERMDDDEGNGARPKEPAAPAPPSPSR